MRTLDEAMRRASAEARKDGSIIYVVREMDEVGLGMMYRLAEEGEIGGFFGWESVIAEFDSDGEEVL